MTTQDVLHQHYRFDSDIAEQMKEIPAEGSLCPIMCLVPSTQTSTSMTENPNKNPMSEK